MGRAPRMDIADIVYHVINRANARAQIFDASDDYALFEDIVKDARERIGMRIMSYCIMSNHWHLILQPREDGDLSKFMHWLTLTHTQRWHAMKETIGSGHLYPLCRAQPTSRVKGVRYLFHKVDTYARGLFECVPIPSVYRPDQ